MTGLAEPKLRILHILRAPVGGLFRHVIDLAKEQIARGHQVGLVTDSNTGGDHAADVLDRLKPSLALGVLRMPMTRQPSPFDVTTAIKIGSHANKLGIDVIHGHGAKGGIYARFPSPWFNTSMVTRAYTPHGGSFSITMPTGLQRFYMLVERIFTHLTDAYLFESSFVAGRFAQNIGATGAITRIAPNGISAAEFTPIEPLPEAADFLFVGELRRQKGVELLIDALAELSATYGTKLRLVLVGNGSDRGRFLARVKALGLEDQVIFMGPLPAAEAFKLGRILVLPSHGESLPYVILEAAGAQIPIIASDVGDIGNILAPYHDYLVPPNDLEKLVAAMRNMLSQTPKERQHQAICLSALVAERYSITTMVDTILAVYREALDRKAARLPHSHTSFALRS